MKLLKCFSAAIFMILSYTNASAQQPQSVQQMIEAAKKQIAQDNDMDPADRAKLLKMMNSKDVKTKTKWMDAHPKEIQAAAHQEEKMMSLPLPDKKRLAKLPSGPLSAAKMDEYLIAMDTKLESQLSEIAKTDVRKMIIISGSSSEKLTSLAIVTWYNGNPEEGLLLAIRAAKLHKDSLSLNNLGAMLDEAGYEEKAIPVLQYGLAKSQINVSLLNNLGRAYLGLGDKKKAKQMFLMCVAHAPTHPEANNALGCLYEEEGNTDEAVSRFEKSIEGAYNENAYEHLSRLQHDEDIVKLMNSHYKARAYFNQFSVEVPPECTDIKTQKVVELQHEVFQKGMDDLIGKYAEMEYNADQASRKLIEQFQHTVANNLSEGKAVKITVSPFIKISNIVLKRLLKNYMDDTAKSRKDYDLSINSLMINYAKDVKKTGVEYDSQKKMGPMGECGICCLNCDEVNKRACKALAELASSYQQKAADLHTEFRQRYRRVLLNYFDDMLYWSCLMGVNTFDMQGNFYQTIEAFLNEMKYLSETTPFIPFSDCDHQQYEPTNTEKQALNANKKPFCPFSLDISFVVGKMSLDCTSFSLSGGEGITGGYKKDFTNGQTTLTIGAGLSATAGIGKTGANASVGQSIYVTFDGNGNPTDVGIKMSAGAGFSAGPISTGVDAGYTVSMNSGWNFTHSGFNNSISL